MQGTNFFEEVSSLFSETSSIQSLVQRLLFSSFISNVKTDCRATFDRSILLRFLVLTKLMGVFNIKQVYNTSLGKLIPFKKDVLYTFRNSCHINWRRLLYRSAVQSLEDINMKSDSDEAWEIPCFILDDSDAPKRGKCMELVGRIFSHVHRSYPLGYKSLNLGLWSGKHLVHLDMSYHVELGKQGNQGLSAKERKSRYSKKRPKGSHGAVRINEAFDTKIANAIKMMKRALKAGIRPPYILADSWFFCQKLCDFAINNCLDLISRPKMNNWKYTHQGRPYTLRCLIGKLSRQKMRVNSRKLKMHTMTTTVEFKGQPFRIFFFKQKKRGSKWHALISTNRKLSAIKAYQIYKNRWAIEVSYKELKQHFGYGKSQCQDFDGHISDATISLIAYNMISHHKAIHNYESIGGLFVEISQDWILPNLMVRFWKEFVKILEKLAQLLEINVEWLMEKVLADNKFLNKVNILTLKLTPET